MYCKKCGNEIMEEFETCPYCKTPIEKNQISYNHQSYKRPMSGLLSTLAIVIGIVALIYGFSKTIELAEKWDQYPNTQTTTTTTSPSTTQTYPSTTTTQKNYQQIYNEYSQKLISAGPTSSISEMADILYEGVEKMAIYMYSASGTDGQYATYESWVEKLTNVYLENCR